MGQRFVLLEKRRPPSRLNRFCTFVLATAVLSICPVYGQEIIDPTSGSLYLAVTDLVAACQLTQAISTSQKRWETIP